MHIEIRGLKSERPGALDAHIERRLRFALGRFSERVGRVIVCLSVTNEHHLGADQRCQIEVSVIPAGNVSAEATDIDIYSAIEHAVTLAAQSITRFLAGERDHRRGS